MGCISVTVLGFVRCVFPAENGHGSSFRWREFALDVAEIKSTHGSEETIRSKSMPFILLSQWLL